MNTVEYIDAIKKKLSVSSNYAVAQKLNITKQAMSRYTQGKNHFDDSVCAKVSEILEIHPGIVMLDMYRQRAATPEQAGVWNDIYKGFCSLLLPAKRTFV